MPQAVIRKPHVDGEKGLGFSRTASRSTAHGNTVDMTSSAEHQVKSLLLKSAKMQFLDVFLTTLREDSPLEKVVIVSNFLGILDATKQLADHRGWTCLRLDGGVQAADRQSLVDRFNMPFHIPSQKCSKGGTGDGSSDDDGSNDGSRDGYGEGNCEDDGGDAAGSENCSSKAAKHSKPRKATAPPVGVFLFLLSARAGGVGINLIGGSRLIMMDCEWNPAIDKQAMARIWRQGQKKPVFIYRLITSGLIEETIIRRQTLKSGLEAVLGNDPGQLEKEIEEEESSKGGDSDLAMSSRSVSSMSGTDILSLMYPRPPKTKEGCGGGGDDGGDDYGGSSGGNGGDDDDEDEQSVYLNPLPATHIFEESIFTKHILNGSLYVTPGMQVHYVCKNAALMLL